MHTKDLTDIQTKDLTDIQPTDLVDIQPSYLTDIQPSTGSPVLRAQALGQPTFLGDSPMGP